MTMRSMALSLLLPALCWTMVPSHGYAQPRAAQRGKVEPRPRLVAPARTQTTAARGKLELTPAQRSAARKLERSLSRRQRAAVRQLGGTWLRRAREAAARGQRSFAPSAGQLPPEIASISDEDAGAVAALAMTAAVDQAEQELRSLAQRVDAGREKQAGLRESIAELRSIIQSRKFPVAFEYGDPATTVELRDARQAKALLEQLETELQGATDISQQLQLQLQDAMNKQQQAVQILSNLMKQQHDTLKAIIQNMR